MNVLVLLEENIVIIFGFKI